MQTGCDNFWMYQSSRQEPVCNLQKNDNYAYPVITDNYNKQMQNGGCPSNIIVTTLSNVASSQNGQYTTGPHCVWPSSAYSLPLNSSYAKTFHSQGFPSQANNFSYSSHYPQPKTDMRTYNMSVPQKSKINNQKQIITRQPQISNCTDTENSRIRVKDVFTLNNDSIYNTVSDNSLVQTQKNKEMEYSLNYTANNCNRTCDFESNLSVSKHFPSSYEQARLNNQQQFIQYPGTPYQQNVQISSGCQSQSNGNRQREDNLQSVDCNRTNAPVLTRLLRSNKNQEEAQNCDALDVNKRIPQQPNRVSHLSCLEAVTSRLTPERTNNIENHGSSQLTETVNRDGLYTNGVAFVQNQNRSQNLGEFPEFDPKSSLSQNSSVEDSRKRHISEQIVTSNAKSFSNSRTSSLENNLVKITIPLTGQTTYINPNESTNRKRNSTTSLSNSLESHDEIFHDTANRNNTQNYIQHNGSNPLPESNPVRRRSCNASPGRNHAYNISVQSIPDDRNSTSRHSNNNYFNNTMTPPRNPIASAQTFWQEPFNSPKRQEVQTAFSSSKNSSENTRDNFSKNICDGNEHINSVGSIENSPESDNSIFCETVFNNVTIKEEISDMKTNSLTTQSDQNINAGQIYERIKAESCEEVFEVEQEYHSSEKVEHLEGNLLSNSNDNRNKSVVSNNECVSSKIFAKSNCRNCSPELEIIPNEKDKTEKNTPDEKASLERAKKCTEEKNYVCKINRDKLDLLIEFLKEDDEVLNTKKVQTKDDEVNAKTISDESKKIDKINLTRSRRKLSKTHIVKNKNNSREMVSLVSHKTPRTEIQESSKHPQIAKIDENSNNKEEGKSNCSDEVGTDEKRIHNLEKEVKFQDLFYENEKKSDLKPESKTENISTVSRNEAKEFDKEKNIVNVMQALQNLKSHFCLSCTLVSPIESFWINVVSGDLKCLNCFKKMTLKTEEDSLKLKRISNDEHTEPKHFPEEKIKKEYENKKDQKLKKCTCELTNGKSKEPSVKKLKEPEMQKSKESELKIKQETVTPENESAKGKTVHTSNVEQNIISKLRNEETKDAIRLYDVARKKSVEEEKKLSDEGRRERSEKSSPSEENFTLKVSMLEENRKSELRAKRKSSTKEESVPDKTQSSGEKISLVQSRKKSNSGEGQIEVNTSAINHSKQCSDFHGKKHSVVEQIGSPKIQLHKDSSAKERRPSSQSTGKSISKEHHVFHKSPTLKDGLEEESRSNSEKPIKQSSFEEKDVSEVAKKDKKQSKDSSQGRKRTNSKEDLVCHKVRISEDENTGTKSLSRESVDQNKCHTPEGILKKNTYELLDKSKMHDFSKDICFDQRVKISKHVKLPLEDSEKKASSVHKNLEKEKFMETVDYHRKRRKSVEDLNPSKIRVLEEHLKDPKFSKHTHKKSKTENSPKADDTFFKNKPSDHSKQVNVDLKLESRRKSKDDWLTPKEQSEENLSSQEHSKKEIVNESSKGDYEKEKKYFSGKLSKNFYKNLEKFEVTKSLTTEDKHQKSSLSTKPLKESQGSASEHKISSPNQILKKKEAHENKLKHKEHFEGKTERKKNEKQTDLKNFEVGNKSEKKKSTEQEVYKVQRHDKGLTLSQSKKNKALECIFGRRKEDLFSSESRKVCGEEPPSPKLMEKLVERTKKLSWTLLSKP